MSDDTTTPREPPAGLVEAVHEAISDSLTAETESTFIARAAWAWMLRHLDEGPLRVPEPMHPDKSFPTYDSGWDDGKQAAIRDIRRELGLDV